MLHAFEKKKYSVTFIKHLLESLLSIFRISGKNCHYLISLKL